MGPQPAKLAPWQTPEVGSMGATHEVGTGPHMGMGTGRTGPAWGSKVEKWVSCSFFLRRKQQQASNKQHKNRGMSNNSRRRSRRSLLLSLPLEQAGQAIAAPLQPQLVRGVPVAVQNAVKQVVQQANRSAATAWLQLQSRTTMPLAITWRRPRFWRLDEQGTQLAVALSVTSDASRAS